MNIKPRRNLFRRERRSNLYRIFAWVILILAGSWLASRLYSGGIRNPYLPTPTPTRTVQSYALEGEALFTAGKLEAAIQAYSDAGNLVKGDPTSAEILAKLARIQTYSSSLLTTDAERKQRLAEALKSIDQAVSLAPDNSTVHAVRSFVLDWSASAATTDTETQSLLIQAEQEATRGLQLDSQNVLVQAFFAEILVDQQKMDQARLLIEQALKNDPTVMDVHRVNAYMLESLAQYPQAIEEYQKALEIDPNLTFLYISIGTNYRILAFKSDITDQRNQLYDQALEYFAKAANLNKQLEIKDPLPYIAIAKTYSQQGDFFAAALNIKQALAFDPANAGIYGQLGIIYFKARNYEGSIPILKCAVRGCTPDESCMARYDRACNAANGETGVSVTFLPLSANSVVYYYTYGSAMAALSRPQLNYCTDAVAVLTEVQSAYGSDPTISQIVNDGLSICSSLVISLTQTPTPIVTPTPLPTPKP